MTSINISMDVPDRFTPEELFAALDRVKAEAEKALPLEGMDEVIFFGADWEDDEGINYWSP